MAPKSASHKKTRNRKQQRNKRTATTNNSGSKGASRPKNSEPQTGPNIVYNDSCREIASPPRNSEPQTRGNVIYDESGWEIAPPPRNSEPQTSINRVYDNSDIEIASPPKNLPISMYSTPQRKNETKSSTSSKEEKSAESSQWSHLSEGIVNISSSNMEMVWKMFDDNIDSILYDRTGRLRLPIFKQLAEGKAPAQ